MRHYLIALLLVAPFAHAHVKLEPAQGTVGSTQKLSFRVGHGCDGSATNGITVTLPEGVRAAEPQARQGWTTAASVHEASWKGGPLPATTHDEFVLQVTLPDRPGTLVFPVVQSCEGGKSASWTTVPKAGAHVAFPAPLFEVVPAGLATPQH